MPSDAGAPEATLRSALYAMEHAGAQVHAVSEFYRTPCFPVGYGPDYVNAAAKITCDGEPDQVLAMLHDIEAQFGRERVQRWGRRTLDLDLVAVGDLTLPDQRIHAEWRNLPADQQTSAVPDLSLIHI